MFGKTQEVKVNLHYQSLLTVEDFWFKCDLYLQFIAPINLWNKCIDLRLFLKCKEGPFLRSWGRMTIDIEF